MIEDLSHYKNLGTPKIFFELFLRLSAASDGWTKKNIDEYFHNKIIDGYFVFDGCFALAESIGAIIIKENGLIVFNPIFQELLVDEKLFSNKLITMVVAEAQKDQVFYEIFSEENVSYDSVDNNVLLDFSAFPLHFASFRDLLINFGFLYSYPDDNVRKYVMNPAYRDLFDKEVLPEIRKRGMRIDALEKMLELNQKYGKEAEAFVLGFEKKRLSSHMISEGVVIISDYDVSAGYDIASYENGDSLMHDRFIEVKSFVGAYNFYWSRNEIDVARIKRHHYYLYLVDREKISDKGYTPYIIQNPYESIMEKETGWNKKAEKYFITKIE